VGHLGCVFSTIEDNHIYNIAVKREFYGYEIGGIKLHAALDVIIRHNRIHDCSLAIWLDWQTQGTRVSRNLLYGNSRDLFVEVSHGPYVVDHNVLASRVSLESFSQGGAYVNNLVCGTVYLEPVLERPTPYHRPHSTQVAGYAAILGGDDRHIGNIFLGGDPALAYGETSHRRLRPVGHGTAGYNGHPPSLEAYLALVADPSRGDHERFRDVKQPVYIRDNVYAAGAKAFEAEEGAILLDGDVTAAVVDEGAEVYLECQLPVDFDTLRVDTITGADLGHVRFVDADFEEPDGTPVVLGADLVGVDKTPSSSYPAGPVTTLASGKSRIRIW
jgi:hypothetical protein